MGTHHDDHDDQDDDDEEEEEEGRDLIINHLTHLHITTRNFLGQRRSVERRARPRYRGKLFLQTENKLQSALHPVQREEPCLKCKIDCAAILRLFSAMEKSSNGLASAKSIGQHFRELVLSNEFCLAVYPRFVFQFPALSSKFVLLIVNAYRS